MPPSSHGFLQGYTTCNWTWPAYASLHYVPFVCSIEVNPLTSRKQLAHTPLLPTNHYRCRSTSFAISMSTSEYTWLTWSAAVPQLVNAHLGIACTFTTTTAAHAAGSKCYITRNRVKPRCRQAQPENQNSTQCGRLRCRAGRKQSRGDSPPSLIQPRAGQHQSQPNATPHSAPHRLMPLHK